MTEAFEYGDKYFFVKVPISVSPEEGITIFANIIEILPDGTIVFLSKAREDGGYPLLALNKGSWIYISAVSVIDGHPVAIDQGTLT